MYETTFGTDWAQLDREEAIRRAFALGVADGCGRPDVDEYERVQDALPQAYDRSMVDLAYEEGRTKALGMKSTDEAEVWSELVDEAGNPVEPPLRTKLPGALNELTLLRREDGRPSSFDLPSFLRK